MFMNKDKNKSRAQILNEMRGKPPRGMRWTSSSVYMPAGPRKNVTDAKVRNPAQGLQMNRRYAAWHEKKFGKKPDEALFGITA